MKRRYANAVGGEYAQARVDTEYFNGYVCDVKINNVERPLIVNNGKNDVCIKDNGYEWIEIYPDNANYAITIMIDQHKNIIEWYFDIAKEIGVENGIPYEEDLFLDMIITPGCEYLVLDEDELDLALSNQVITQSDFDLAYKTLALLKQKYVGNFKELKELTIEFYKMFNDEYLNIDLSFI